MSKLEELRSHFSGTEKISYTQADRKFVFSFLEVAKIEEVEIFLFSSPSRLSDVDLSKTENFESSKNFYIKFKQSDIYAFIATNERTKNVKFIDIAFSEYCMRMKEFTSEEVEILDYVVTEAKGGNVKDDFEQTFRKHTKIKF